MNGLAQEVFFERMDEQGLALTYGDVKLRTRSGSLEELPDVLDVTSHFSTNVDLKIPLVSAAMDTVTESDMAIAMAKLGGIGVIHAALSIEDQRREVRRVKKATNGLIDSPVCVDERQTVANVLDMCDRKGYDFRTFPVTDANGNYAGIVTGGSFDFAESGEASISEIMIKQNGTQVADSAISVNEAYMLMTDARVRTLPVVEEGKVAGLFLYSDVRRIMRDIGDYNVDPNSRLRTAAAVSTGKDTLERVDRLSKYLDVVVIDTADGDSYYSFQTLKSIKNAFPNLDVVVGNITDGDSAVELAKAGADGIKVGQGPGSICSTRRETGVGLPQVTAVYECTKALREAGSDIPVCADGGVRERGDIEVALAVGASSVMMGRLLAGTTESPGEVISRKDTSKVKLYRGMGSLSALRDNSASRERYGANGRGAVLPEGVESYIPYTGDVSQEIDLCVAAIRKGMRYIKAPNLDTLRREARLIRLTPAAVIESSPHGIELISG